MNMLKWTMRAGAAASAATIGLLATGAILTPAAADAPSKVGWWNEASANGTAAPAPDAPAGGIRVAVTSSQTTSYGAVELAIPSDGNGTLTLNIAQMTGNSAQMLNGISACPTKDDSWTAGDDQDWSKAPAADCSTHSYVGSLSSDGKSISFNLDGAADQTPGTLSIAIVPTPNTGLPEVGTDTGTGVDTNPPFVIDFAKPDATAFSCDNCQTSEGSLPPPPPPSDTGSAGFNTGTQPTTVTPQGPTSVSVPAATTTDAGQTPVVAPNTGAQQQTQPLYQTAAAKPASGTPHRDLLFVLLIALLFGFLYTQNMQSNGRGPRLLTRQPAPVPAGDGAAAATVALPMPYPGVPARGIGRFAKQRTTGARPLI